MPLEDRVAQVLDWFSGDSSTFPNLVLMYFEQPDSMGHAVGPYGDRVFTLHAIMQCNIVLVGTVGNLLKIYGLAQVVL